MTLDYWTQPYPVNVEHARQIREALRGKVLPKRTPPDRKAENAPATLSKPDERPYNVEESQWQGSGSDSPWFSVFCPSAVVAVASRPPVTTPEHSLTGRCPRRWEYGRTQLHPKPAEQGDPPTLFLPPVDYRALEARILAQVDPTKGDLAGDFPEPVEISVREGFRRVEFLSALAEKLEQAEASGLVDMSKWRELVAKGRVEVLR